jgi:hypothetical protein
MSSRSTREKILPWFPVGEAECDPGLWEDGRCARIERVGKRGRIQPVFNLCDDYAITVEKRPQEHAIASFFRDRMKSDREIGTKN